MAKVKPVLGLLTAGVMAVLTLATTTTAHAIEFPYKIVHKKYFATDDDEATNKDKKITIGGKSNPIPSAHSAFIDSIAKDAIEVAGEYHIYPSVMIAQAIIESNSGTSDLTRGFNNYFGIKGVGANYATTEYDGSGSAQQVIAGFQSYPNRRACFKHYAELITRAPYYGATRNEAKSPQAVANNIGSTYATSPTYAQSIITTIARFGLDRFDDVDPTVFTTARDIVSHAMDSHKDYATDVVNSVNNDTSNSGKQSLKNSGEINTGDIVFYGKTYGIVTGLYNDKIKVTRNGNHTTVEMKDIISYIASGNTNSQVNFEVERTIHHG